MKSGDVTPLSRLIDAASVILIVAGGALYLMAYFGMENLRNRPHEAFVPGETVAFARTAEHESLMRTSRWGLALAALGLVVGLSAAAHARQIARRHTEPPI